jgi:hypothetical protein
MVEETRNTYRLLVEKHLGEYMLGRQRRWKENFNVNFSGLNYEGPVSIAELSKTCTVYDRLNIEIAGSNPARVMDVCVFLCCVVLCVGRGLALD